MLLDHPRPPVSTVGSKPETSPEGCYWACMQVGWIGKLLPASPYFVIIGTLLYGMLNTHVISCMHIYIIIIIIIIIIYILYTHIDVDVFKK